MSDPVFVLHLGGSTYVTAAGEVVPAVPDGATVYPLPADLRLEPSLMAAALRDLADPDVAVEDVLHEWVAAGQDDAAATALFKMAEVATIIGGVLLSVGQPLPLVLGVIAGVVVSAFAGDDGYDAETVNALDRLRRQFAGSAEIAEIDALLGMRSALQGQFETLRGQFSDLVTHRPSGPARLALFDQMRQTLNAASPAVVRIRDEDWGVGNDPESFKSRFGLSSVLIRFRPDGSTEPVPPQAPGVTRFDHRLGVPMLLYTSTAYATMMRLAVPWFRSDGTFRDQLRDLAASLDRFVVKMQSECWSRTEHSAQTLFRHEIFPLSLYFGSPFSLTAGGSLPTAGAGRTYPVGAFDLLRYSDAYVSRRFGEALGAGDTGAIGTFDYTWGPPAALLDSIGRLVDRQKGAAAANERARDDYARLVVTSGAVHLLITSALLRHLSAPPTASESVAGSATSSRRSAGEAPATATSPVIFPNVTVTSPATLRRYDASARVRFTTQAPGHRPALRYRVLLRTVDSRIGHDGWRDEGYLGRVWRSELESLPGDPRNKRLRTDVDDGLVLDERLLYEGVSPERAVGPAEEPRTVALAAHTYDWYVPVLPSPWALGVADLDRSLARVGWATPGSRSIHLTDALAPGQGIAPLRTAPPAPTPVLVRPGHPWGAGHGRRHRREPRGRLLHRPGPVAGRATPCPPRAGHHRLEPPVGRRAP